MLRILCFHSGCELKEVSLHHSSTTACWAPAATRFSVLLPALLSDHVDRLPQSVYLVNFMTYLTGGNTTELHIKKKGQLPPHPASIQLLITLVKNQMAILIRAHFTVKLFPEFTLLFRKAMGISVFITVVTLKLSNNEKSWALKDLFFKCVSALSAWNLLSGQTGKHKVSSFCKVRSFTLMFRYYL